MSGPGCPYHRHIQRDTPVLVCRYGSSVSYSDDPPDSIVSTWYHETRVKCDDVDF